MGMGIRMGYTRNIWVNGGKAHTQRKTERERERERKSDVFVVNYLPGNRVFLCH